MEPPLVRDDAFAILLSGPVEPTPALRRALVGRRVIAADGGMQHAAVLQLRPELWVGDFDSSPDALFAIAPHAERLVLNHEKDETDGEAAVRAATMRGGRDLLLLGALGGPRTDHVFSNLVLMMGVAERGTTIAAFDGREHALPLGRTATHLDLAPGTTFSILRFGEVRGLTVHGARWPLEAVDLPFAATLTQSNEALGPVSIRVENGTALVIVQATAV